MKQAEIRKQRFELLKNIESAFGEALVPARFLGAEDENGDGTTPMVLTVLLDNLSPENTDTFGEFFFVPSGEDDEMQIFNSVLTIEDELSEEHMAELMTAANYVNAVVPLGFFVVNPADRTLVYRHSYEMPMPLSDEKLSEAVDFTMGAAINMVERFAYLLTEVNYGERDADSVAGVLIDLK